MVLRIQRSLAQGRQGHERKQSRIAKEGTQFQVTKFAAGGDHSGHYHHIEVEPVSHNYQKTDVFNSFQLPLRITRHEEHEGSEKVQHKTESEPELRGVGRTLVEPGSLFRDPRVPYQQHLRNKDIRPEDAESKHKLADVVKVVFVNSGEVAFLLQRGNHQANGGQAA